MKPYLTKINLMKLCRSRQSCHQTGAARLSRRIYLSFIGVIILFAVMTAVLRITTEPWRRDHLVGTLQLAGRTLPSPTSPREVVQQSLDEWSALLHWDLALQDSLGRRVAVSGRLVDIEIPVMRGKAIKFRRGLGPVTQVKLEDGRTLTALLPHPRRVAWYWWLVILVAAATAGAYPLSRRITRRLERLQLGVEAVGSGDLGKRVKVEGNDEIAQLARSFNRTIEALEKLTSQRTLMLATASHELRTPLTRLRVALELLATAPRPELQDQIQRDISELDSLVGELLLASRLELGNNQERFEQLDLLALAAEEAAQFGLEVRGEPLDMSGDAQALAVLLRNLISNARRYGGDHIEINVNAPSAEMAQVEVIDHGRGIPESERVKIFTPFYRAQQAASDDLRGDLHKDSKGLGLGLYLVQQIARHHGGDASCKAVDSGGCCFQITLARQSVFNH
jgi:signal transduction histidine kinase